MREILAVFRLGASTITIKITTTTSRIANHNPFTQAHTKKVDAVFEAASGGQYRHTGGVDVLLRAYSLPGTVHDHQGRSLLHYAASVQLADGGPLWLAQDVRSLVESHGVLVNAVDFKGECVFSTEDMM